jgi:hypothetical protein
MAKRGKPPARSTMHREIVILRQTLKTALRHGWLERLPDLSEPYAHPPKSPIGRGSLLKNTNNSTKTRARTEAGALPMGIGAVARLCTVWGQYRPAAYIHLPAPDGRSRHIPDREELPHQRRDDRKILCGAHQNQAGCCCDQRCPRGRHARRLVGLKAGRARGGSSRQLMVPLLAAKICKIEVPTRVQLPPSALTTIKHSRRSACT